MTETPESGSSENPDRKRPSNTMSSPFRSNLVFVSFTNSGSETLPRDFITTSRRVPGIKPFSLRSQISPGSSSGATMVMSLAKNAVSCLFKYSKKIHSSLLKQITSCAFKMYEPISITLCITPVHFGINPTQSQRIRSTDAQLTFLCAGGHAIHLMGTSDG